MASVAPLVSLEGETPDSPKEYPKSCSDFGLLPSMGTDKGRRETPSPAGPSHTGTPHPWKPGEEARDSHGSWALGTKAFREIRQGPSSGEGDPKGSIMI